MYDKLTGFRGTSNSASLLYQMLRGSCGFWTREPHSTQPPKPNLGYGYCRHSTSPSQAGAGAPLHTIRSSMADATADSISGATDDISDLLPMRIPLVRAPEFELYCFRLQEYDKCRVLRCE